MRFKKRQVVESLTGYLLVLPDFLGLLLFIVVPAFMSLAISFFTWDGIGPKTFVGLENYRAMFKDPFFARSIWTTLKLTILAVPINFAISLCLALLVVRKDRGTGLFRTIYFAPVAISGVSIALIWKFMFQQNGVFNGLLNLLGVPAQPWLGSPSQALWVLLTAFLYPSAGYFMVIFIAGLNDIPQEYYDAAAVDGASWTQRFRFITLPLLKPVSLFVLIISMLTTFQLFDQIHILTHGGPFYGTTTMVYYAFRNAFQLYRFGYGAAINVFVVLVQLFLSLAVFKVLRGGKT